MKTFDFSFQHQSKTLSLVAGGLLALCSMCAAAAKPPVDNFNIPTELILTPSDQPQADSLQSANHLLSNAAKSADNPLLAETRKAKPVNLGCGVDVNQLPTENTSLSGRLVGECNFQYHY